MTIVCTEDDDRVSKESEDYERTDYGGYTEEESLEPGYYVYSDEEDYTGELLWLKFNQPCCYYGECSRNKEGCPYEGDTREMLCLKEPQPDEAGSEERRDEAGSESVQDSEYSYSYYHSDDTESTNCSDVESIAPI